MGNPVKVYRCYQGNCKKMSTTSMIQYYKVCYGCGFNKFSGCGKIGTIEAIIVLIRNYLIKRKLKRERKKNDDFNNKGKK